MRTKKIKSEFVITGITRRLSVGGVWVLGRHDGHCFEALVFSDHAAEPSWEIGKSRISKLWLKRCADGSVVYNWDRGLDIGPADKAAATTVEWLATYLADRVFPQYAER